MAYSNNDDSYNRCSSSHNSHNNQSMRNDLAGFGSALGSKLAIPRPTPERTSTNAVAYVDSPQDDGGDDQKKKIKGWSISQQKNFGLDEDDTSLGITKKGNMSRSFSVNERKPNSSSSSYSSNQQSALSSGRHSSEVANSMFWLSNFSKFSILNKPPVQLGTSQSQSLNNSIENNFSGYNRSSSGASSLSNIASGSSTSNMKSSTSAPSIAKKALGLPVKQDPAKARHTTGTSCPFEPLKSTQMYVEEPSEATNSQWHNTANKKSSNAGRSGYKSSTDNIDVNPEAKSNSRNNNRSSDWDDNNRKSNSDSKSNSSSNSNSYSISNSTSNSNSNSNSKTYGSNMRSTSGNIKLPISPNRDNKSREIGDKSRQRDVSYDQSSSSRSSSSSGLSKKKKPPEIVDLLDDDDDDDDDVKYVDPSRASSGNSSSSNNNNRRSDESLRRSSRKKAGDLNSNSPIVLVYPMEEEDLDCVTIRESDIKRLDKYVYLNDSLIDLQVKIDIENFASEMREKVHAFNCFFIPRLTETNYDSNFSLIARWTRKVNLWSKNFIFIPINEDNHWSLIVVVRPYLCLTLTPPADSGEQMPCLLIMDSLGMHDPRKFSKIIRDYLVNELKYRHANSTLFSMYSAEDIDIFAQNIQNLRSYKVPIPRQLNGYDCGVYVIKYVRYVLDVWPVSTLAAINGGFRDQFSSNHFTQDDIDSKRDEIRNLIWTLSGTWRGLVEKRRSDRIEAKAKRAAAKERGEAVEDPSNNDNIDSDDSANVVEDITDSKKTEKRHYDSDLEDDDDEIINSSNDFVSSIQ